MIILRSLLRQCYLLFALVLLLILYSGQGAIAQKSDVTKSPQTVENAQDPKDNAGGFSLERQVNPDALDAASRYKAVSGEDVNDDKKAPRVEDAPSGQSKIDLGNANENELADDLYVDPIEDIEKHLKFAINQAETLEDEFTKNQQNDNELIRIGGDSIKIAEEILDQSAKLTPEIVELNRELAAIGTVPAKEKGEAEVTTEKRERSHLLVDVKNDLNLLLHEASFNYTMLYGIVDKIKQRRKELFYEKLTTNTPIKVDLILTAPLAYWQEGANVVRTLSKWGQYIFSYMLHTFMIVCVISLFLLFFSYAIYARLYGFFHQEDDGSDSDKIPYIVKLSRALWYVFASTGCIAFFLYGVYEIFYSAQLLRSGTDRLFWDFINASMVLLLIFRISIVVFAPYQPQWRFFRFADEPAIKLHILVCIIGVVTTLDRLFGHVSAVMNSNIETGGANALLTAVVVGSLLIAIGMIKPFVNRKDEPIRWPKYVRRLYYTFGIIPIFTAFLGFVVASRFMLQQFVVTGAILMTMYLGYLFAKVLADEQIFAESSYGRWFARRGYSDAAIGQMSLICSFFTHMIVFLVGIPLVLMQWSYRFHDIWLYFSKLGSDFTLGSVSVSLIEIFTGLGVFVVGYLFTRWFQAWLDGTVLQRGRLDSGVRHSIRTGIGYLGFGATMILGILAAGINLSSFALVAGALSLGIGFGLQNVVSNFVSGLILLVERPFKVGDWIDAGAYSGLVKKISVRATEIETFQRQAIILPNSELINSAVGNWTHRNHLGRIEIPVGVAYGTDPKRVIGLLEDIAAGQDLILSNPAPMVYFSNFGDSSLDFELRVFVADIFNSISVQNGLRLKIAEVFEAENIEIPFPQQDLHIRSGLSPLELRQTQAVTPRDASASGAVDGDVSQDKNKNEA